LALPACAGNGGPKAKQSTGGKLHFEGQTFNDTTTFLSLAKNGEILLEFVRCTFTGPARFTTAGNEFGAFTTGAVFRDCTFEQDLIADQTQFMGRLNMVNCRFKKRAQFINCTFMAPAGWRTCAFDADAAWNNSLFMREANYMDCNFSDVARLQACRFLSTVQFSNSIFRKYADFTLCRFDEGAWLDFTVFNATADLSSARALGPITFRAAQVGKLFLNNVQAFAPVNLGGLITTDSVRYQGSWFAKGKPVIGPK